MMFTQLCLSLALAVASTRALTINTPTNPTSGGTTSITWSSTSDDPCVLPSSPLLSARSSSANVQNSVFSIELNHPSFNSALAVANNVNPADNNHTVNLPPVPAECISRCLPSLSASTPPIHSAVFRPTLSPLHLSTLTPHIY
ncbi:hypothetical protein B0H14DRAFT_2790094 [Mycena olivaceomarginata]|nr:hypothetical protein B0H14DRAFT_2790094 [Mycena olivaceomarginata]